MDWLLVLVLVVVVAGRATITTVISLIVSRKIYNHNPIRNIRQIIMKTDSRIRVAGRRRDFARLWGVCQRMV